MRRYGAMSLKVVATDPDYAFTQEHPALRGPAGDGEELLEVYDVNYEGSAPRRMYFNWFDDGETRRGR